MTTTNPHTSARLRRLLVATTLAAAVLATAVGSAAHAGPLGSADDFTPVRGRLLDTRTGTTSDNFSPKVSGVRAAGSTTEVKVASRLSTPYNAPGAVLTVTIDSPASGGWATVYPCASERPNASSVNFQAGVSVANTAIVPIDAQGKVCVFTSVAAHVVLDLQGYFNVGSKMTLGTPARYLDTRPGQKTFDSGQQGQGMLAAGTTKAVYVQGRGQVSSDATSVVITLTATQAAAKGWMTVFPCGSARPNASSINFAAGQTVANTMIATIGTTFAICIYTSANVHAIVDVSGFATTESNYAPLNPARLLDTRAGMTTIDGLEQAGGTIGGQSARYVAISARGGMPGVPKAVVLNVTVTGSAAAGELRIRECNTGNQWEMRFQAGQTIAKSAVVSLMAAGNVCISATTPVHVIIDGVGYFSH